jgi:hypothetical protein
LKELKNHQDKNRQSSQHMLSGGDKLFTMTHYFIQQLHHSDEPELNRLQNIKLHSEHLE